MLRSPPRAGDRVLADTRETAITVLIASDVRLLCDALALGLPAPGEVDVTGTVGNAGELLRRARCERPRIVVLDVSMPDAFHSARLIRQELKGTAIVAVAVGGSVSRVVACAEAGFSGYVEHDASLDDLRETVARVAAGESPCSGRVAAGLFERLATLSAEREGRTGPPRPLTPREYEIVDLIDRGLSNKEIATQLHIAVPTVKNHVHRILEKLHVQRRSQAAAYVRR